MGTVEEQHDAVENSSELVHIPLTELVIAIVERRRFLAQLTLAGMLISAVIVFLIPVKYTSTADLMPPDAQSVSTSSLLTALSGNLPAPTLGGSYMSARTPGTTAIGILSSRTSLDDLIDRYNLLHVFHCKLYADARYHLAEETSMDEDKRTGIVSIAVTDHDRYLARDIAEGYVEELDKLLTAVNTSSAQRERMFLEDRLKSLKDEMDATSIALSHFSSSNATLNPQGQAQTLFQSAATLQGQLIIAQSDLSALKAEYSPDNVRVREASARAAELQSQLQKMSGEGTATGDGTLKSDQLYPSIRELPLLGVTYSDLSRQLSMQESIYETLTKQYELAKVQEAKDVPAIKVLDSPELPEKKSYPHRITFILLATLFSAFAGSVWIIVCRLWDMLDDSTPLKAALVAASHDISGSKAAAASSPKPKEI